MTDPHGFAHRAEGELIRQAAALKERVAALELECDRLKAVNAELAAAPPLGGAE